MTAVAFGAVPVVAVEDKAAVPFISEALNLNDKRKPVTKAMVRSTSQIAQSTRNANVA